MVYNPLTPDPSFSWSLGPIHFFTAASFSWAEEIPGVKRQKVKIKNERKMLILCLMSIVLYQ